MTASIHAVTLSRRDHGLLRQVAVSDARVDAARSAARRGTTKLSPGAASPVNLPSVNLSAGLPLVDLADRPHRVMAATEAAIRERGERGGIHGRSLPREDWRSARPADLRGMLRQGCASSRSASLVVEGRPKARKDYQNAHPQEDRTHWRRQHRRRARARSARTRSSATSSSSTSPRRRTSRRARRSTSSRTAPSSATTRRITGTRAGPTARAPTSSSSPPASRASRASRRDDLVATNLPIIRDVATTRRSTARTRS